MYTLNGWILSYVNYIPKELLKKVNQKIKYAKQ